MRRILVIGSPGAGKSTLAVALSGILGLPVIHLDAEFWRPGWTETPKDEWRRRVETLLAREAWVIDGNYGGTLDLRIQAADMVIFLDLPRHRCLLGVLLRAVRHRGRTRPDLAAGCPEQFPDRQFLRFIWRYPSEQRPRVLAMLRGADREKRVVVLRSRAAVGAFLASLARPAV